MSMIHQPVHVVGVVVYAAMSLAAVACAWARLRSRSATALQRKAGWCVLLVGLGLAGYAADDWRIATEWPPTGTVHYTAWHHAGAACIAIGVLSALWASRKPEDEEEQRLGPSRGTV